MKILFHLGHPAHYHLFKNIIKNLQKQEHTIFILIKKKDILEDLLKESKFSYYNILPEGRKDNKFFIALGLIKQTLKVLLFSFKNKPNLLIGTSASIGPVGKILNIPSLNIQEDDAEIIPRYTKIAYPTSSYIIAPNVCSVGKFQGKKIGYEGYHELAYLHPKNFNPSIEIANQYVDTSKPFYIIRFAKLTAHHDDGIKGISTSLAQKIIERLTIYGNIYITSERELEPQFEQYRIKINPIHMHHVINYASMYLGDSQTMAAEAGVLGIPFLRINDFVGKIGYLKELEEKYKLGFGFFPTQEKEILQKIDTLLNIPNLREHFQEIKKKMLEDKIDVAAFFTWLFDKYPNSVDYLKIEPTHINSFK